MRASEVRRPSHPVSLDHMAHFPRSTHSSRLARERERERERERDRERERERECPTLTERFTPFISSSSSSFFSSFLISIAKLCASFMRVLIYTHGCINVCM